MAIAKGWSFGFVVLAVLTCSFAYREHENIGVDSELKTWCIANSHALTDALQKDIDVLCNVIDCSSIKPGGSCYEPNTVLTHASVVFNLYYRPRDGNKATCNFGGDAMLTNTDPSHGNCIYQ